MKKETHRYIEFGFIVILYDDGSQKLLALPESPPENIKVDSEEIRQ